MGRRLADATRPPGAVVLVDQDGANSFEEVVGHGDALGGLELGAQTVVEGAPPAAQDEVEGDLETLR